MTAQVKHEQSVAYTDAFAIIAEGWNEMVQAGCTLDRVAIPPFSASAQVLYAISADNDIIGVIVFERPDNSYHYDVHLAYVEPSSRRKGVFSQLFKELVLLGKGDGVRRVSLITGKENHEMIAAMRQFHAAEAHVILECDV